ncbi:zinc metalloprotease [Flavobacterium branchiophilum]|uniref:Zinc metalloprotease n=1 Tax=Flavobacterium branchiophilum TaxID=55197 RepID=A0A2H3K9C0_9FLAO|nr:zinc metalloprotease [Flavobacterium branchiophilum]PDS22668.1 zinc metalloprotease [Flavobacterium branchiophilum]
MKKIIFTIGIVSLSLLSCQEEKGSTTEEAASSEGSLQKRGCATAEHLEQQLLETPSLSVKMAEIEAFTEKTILQNPKNLKLVNGKIQIPVVVNVLYKTTAENISQAQIQSQIDVLNRDFNALNTDFSSVPSLFAGVKANVEITFYLQSIIRKKTTTTSYSTNDAMKKNTTTGIAPTTPTTVLNLWSCNLGGGILGYAQFPGGATSTDGVVIDNNAFGTTGTVSAPYNKGRTGTHEVGHWLNLRHIWGDATCGNDMVLDTPSHNGPNYGNPVFPHYSTCTGTPVEMTMNYMDYTDDLAMYMFTNGQKARMAALFVSGGARYSFGQ